METVQSREIKIFIGSSHDVEDERNSARDVIADLQLQYDNHVKLVPVLWEDMRLPATSTFQEAIEQVLAEKHRIDIALFVFWAWFGSPPGGSIKKYDDSDYQSGTEREFDVMTAAYVQSGGKSPLTLVYTREDEKGFSAKLDTTKNSDTAIGELWRQRGLLKEFIHKKIQPESGPNKGAYHTYKSTVGFSELLYGHLREYIEDLLGFSSAAALWKENPYRSLEVFDICHEPIFRGRDRETCDLLQLLRDQQLRNQESRDQQKKEKSSTFVCIIGASGSGKSSLARAGVAAKLLRTPYDETARKWRTAIMLPSLAPANLLAVLATKLAEALPELRESPGEFDLFDRALAEGNDLAVDLLLETAFKTASLRRQGPVRLLLVLDQMEELWTAKEITEVKREQFLHAIEALASSAHISVLATLRIDFYPHAQSSETFRRMKGRRGHYDLPKPGEIALKEMILRPALSAGLKFELDKTAKPTESAGRTLADQILKDAKSDTDGLPLLQYALAELYAKRDEEKGMLTFAAYAAMKGAAKNGIEGALVQRTEQIFKEIATNIGNLTEKEARNAFKKLLPLLVDVKKEGQAVRLRKPLSDLHRTPETRLITDSLIAARFITTDQEGDTPIATLAHEALLRCWTEIVEWIEENENDLRKRHTVEELQHHGTLLEGETLREGMLLLRNAPHLLDEGITRYVRDSIEACLKHAIQNGQNLLPCSDEIEAHHPDEWRKVVSEAFRSDDAATLANAASIMVHRTTPDFQDDLIRLILQDPERSVILVVAKALVARGCKASYDQILASSASATLSSNVRYALAELKACADWNKERPSFADWFDQQTWEVRWRVALHSHGLRLYRSAPAFLFVVIPSMTFAAAGAAGIKWATSRLNYACVQATASLGMGFFHGGIAGVILGGGVAFGVALYRLVFGREYDKLSFLRPMPALAYGMVFGALMGVLTVLMISQIYHPGALYAMGWTSQRTRPDLLPFFEDLFFTNRCGLAFPLTSVGFGLGFALMTNGLRASKEWPKFLDQQTAITGIAKIYGTFKGVVKVTLPFAFPIPMCVIFFAMIALVAMNSVDKEPRWTFSTVKTFFLGGLDDDKSEEAATKEIERIKAELKNLEKNAAKDANSEAIRSKREEQATKEMARRDRLDNKLRIWKTSLDGRCMGLFGDCLAKIIGGYFCAVGLGVGLVALRHGIKIDPRKM